MKFMLVTDTAGLRRSLTLMMVRLGHLILNTLIANVKAQTWWSRLESFSRIDNRSRADIVAEIVEQFGCIERTKQIEELLNEGGEGKGNRV